MDYSNSKKRPVHHHPPSIDLFAADSILTFTTQHLPGVLDTQQMRPRSKEQLLLHCWCYSNSTYPNPYPSIDQHTNPDRPRATWASAIALYHSSISDISSCLISSQLIVPSYTTPYHTTYLLEIPDLEPIHPSIISATSPLLRLATLSFKQQPPSRNRFPTIPNGLLARKKEKPRHSYDSASKERDLNLYLSRIGLDLPSSPPGAFHLTLRYTVQQPT